MAKARESMPADVFLIPETRTFPVKVKREGEWVYCKSLLVAAARRAKILGLGGVASRADRIRAKEFGDPISKEIVTVPSAGADAGLGMHKPTLDGLSSEDIALAVLGVVDPEALVAQLIQRAESMASGVVLPVQGDLYSGAATLSMDARYAIVDNPDDPNLLFAIVYIKGFPSTYGSVADLKDAVPEDQIFMPELDALSNPETPVQVILIDLDTVFDPPVSVSTLYDPQQDPGEPFRAPIALENEIEGKKTKLINLVKERGGPLLLGRDAPKKKLTLLMLEPEYIDAHEDVAPADVIEEGAHDWLDRATRGEKKINLHHGMDVTDEVRVCESYCAKTDETFEDPVFGKQKVKRGSWLVTLGLSDRLWEKVEAGTIDGASFDGGGLAKIFDPRFLIPKDA